MESKFSQQNFNDKVFTVVNYTIMLVLLLVVLYPLMYIVSASFSNPTAVISGKVWLFPVDPTLEGYKAVFEYKGIMKAYMNTIFYVVVGTTLNVTLTILAGYSLSRKDLVGRNLFMMLLVFTMLFNGGLIPTYLLVKDLSLLNTRWALIFPTAMAVWNVIITRTYFQMNIPQEMLEASQLDGCNDFRFLRSVVIPLSGPIIAVISLFYVVGHWNEYFNALIYLRNKNLYPLQLVLREILVQNQLDVTMLVGKDAEVMQQLRDLLKYSLIVVSTIPILLIYPFVQKHFVKGVMIGSLKG